MDALVGTPQGAEWLVILVMLGVPALVVALVVWLAVVRPRRR